MGRASTKDTREEILDSALRLVNARGLAALSTRAVAEDLALSPGNVSYHFPRKENLVHALVIRHGEQNRARLERDVTSPGDFLEMFRALFHGQLRVRGLLLALPDITETFEEIRAHYRRAERARRRRLLDLLCGLRDRGSLAADDRDLARLVSRLTLVARFWVAESRVSYARYAEQRVVAHYLALVADTLAPCATPAARASLAPYLDGWIDDADARD